MLKEDNDEVARLKNTVSLLVTRLSGVHTCIVAIGETVSMRDTFNETETAMAIYRIIDKAHDITFAGMPKEAVLPVMAMVHKYTPEMVQHAKEETLGEYKIVHNMIYQRFRKLVSAWAGKRANGTKS